MNVLFLTPHGPLSVLRHLIRGITLFAPVPQDTLAAAMAGNVFAALPREQDITSAAEELLLSPEFYRGCSEEDAECIQELIATARGVLTGELALDMNGRMLGLTALLRLIGIACRAFPEISSLSVALERELMEPHAPDKIDIAECVRGADRVWRVADLFYGHRLASLIRAVRPEVIFCAGTFPQSMDWAVATALGLRAVCPDSHIFLVNRGKSLYSAAAHFKQALLSSEELFELFDGVVIYPDLQPLTLCEIVGALSSGRSLQRLENLAQRERGAITFEQPTAKTMARYFDEASLGPLHDEVSPFPIPGASPATSRPKLALIYPSPQACYWSRCEFCGINRQNVLLDDPHLSRRADETAACLRRLPSQGYSWAFLGREAVPPGILRGLIERLSGEEGVLPWGFEGRLGQHLGSDFIRGLKQSGCVGAVFGLETVSDRVNLRVGKYVEPEALGLVQIEQIIDDFMAVEMMVHLNTIVDLPGMTEVDFQELRRWLSVRFNRHPLFHFNTNTFRLYRESAMAKQPQRHDIRVLEGDGGAFIPFERTSGDGPISGPDQVWRELFGAGGWRGVPLALLHMLYHETLYLSFLDAAGKENFFKHLQAELRA